MTSHWKRYSLRRGSRPCRKNSARGFGIGLALLGVLLVAPAQAATFTVNSPSDDIDVHPGNGMCATSGGLCTLRAAIAESNALPGADQLILPPNLYALSMVTELIITDDLTITGGGASTTIIDGNKSVRPNSRVLRIGSGITVHISGVTLRNGRTEDGVEEDGGGGGIFNVGTLTLSTSTVSGNTATIDGGGIYNAGTMLLTNSTVNGNTAGDDAGGIRNAPGGTLTLVNSTVSGNTAGDDGGGIRNGLATLTLVNSTVSGNKATLDGGGLYNIGTAHLFNVTITDNQADANLDGFGTGGGVYNAPAGEFNDTGGILQFQNTILAGNFETLSLRDCSGTLTSHGNNVMRQVNCTVTGGGVTVADPRLGPLQDNGGPTLTHALRADSPAIEGGNPGGCRDHLGALLLKDQRGWRRPVDGNRDGTTRCDTGAVEFGSGAGGHRDLNGDGHADLVWQHVATGQVAVWFLDGPTVLGSASLPQVPDSQWALVGIGDLNGDGHGDLVWRHAETGTVAVWFLQRQTITGATTYSASLHWHLAAVGDVDGDGTEDLIWREHATGQVAAWLMQGGALLRGAVIAPFSDPQWILVAAGDLNGDRYADLVWRHATTGDVALWSLTAGTLTGGRMLATGIDPQWQLAAVGDVDDDGHNDFAWSHATTGQVATWLLHEGTVIGAAFLGQAGAEWQMR